MPSERSDPDAVSGNRRLHPASLAFSIGSAARNLLLPALFLLYASRGGATEIWLAVLFFPSALASALRYLSYSYRFGPEHLVIREGIVTRNERNIPYSRIQNVDLVQGPVHRLLGVAEVRLETASGDRPEAVMKVVSMPAVAELRARIFRERSPEDTVDGESAAPPPPAATPLLRLPARELVLLGLVSNRGMALVAAAMGVLWQFDVLGEEWWRDELPRRARTLAEGIRLPGPVVTWIGGALALVALVLLLRVLSVAWTWIRFQGFTLVRDGEDLRSRYGLLTRVTATIPRPRIQRLSTISRPLHRWCGRAVVLAETAGGSGSENDGESGDRRWLAPLIRVGELPAFLAQVLPEIDLTQLDWQPLAPRARIRIARRSAVLVLALTAAAAAWRPPVGGAVLVGGLALAWVHAVLYVRHTAYALAPGAVVHRQGWWVRRTTIVPFEKMQVLSVRQTPFDRRQSMAAVEVDTANAGRIGEPVNVRYLEAGLARNLAERLADEASRKAFRW